MALHARFKVSRAERTQAPIGGSAASGRAAVLSRTEHVRGDLHRFGLSRATAVLVRDGDAHGEKSPREKAHYRGSCDGEGRHCLCAPVPPSTSARRPALAAPSVYTVRSSCPHSMTHPPRLTTIWVVIEDRSVSRLIAMLDGRGLPHCHQPWVEWAIFQSPKQ